MYNRIYIFINCRLVVNNNLEMFSLLQIKKGTFNENFIFQLSNIMNLYHMYKREISTKPMNKSS